MVVPSIREAAPQPASGHDEVVSLDARRTAERTDRLREAVEPVALLLPELPRALEPRLATRVGREEREDRDLVDR